MTICKKLLILTAAALMASSCGKVYIDEEIRIDYMGKGFSPEMDWWGDWFDVKVPKSYLYDYIVLTDAELAAYYTDIKGLVDALPGELEASMAHSGITWKEYLLRGPGECSCDALEPGDYTFYLVEFNSDGTTTGEVYLQEFTVTEGLAFGIDSYSLVFEDSWKPVYLGRGSDVDDDKQPYDFDRFSATGTPENVLYYHVFTVPGALTDANQMLEAFAKGGLEAGGGEYMISAYWDYAAYIRELFNTNIDLSWILACGGPQDDYGFLDYELPSNGVYDVYVVEMLLNGHITGHFGKGTINVDGSPIAKGQLMNKSSRYLGRGHILLSTTSSNLSTGRRRAGKLSAMS